MIDTLLRGGPYYFIFFLLFVIYRKYNDILNRTKYIEDNTVSGNVVLQTKLLCNRRKRLLNYAYLILLIFLGFRGYVYTDFTNYKPFFDMLDGFKNLPEILLIKGWEPGFVVYSALCKTIIPNYFIWNVFSTLIDLFLLYKVLERYSNNHLLSLLVFFVIGSLALEFNVLRNAKAIFLFLYALRFIEERKKWKYFALVGLACLFHISSILYFPLYFFLHKRWPNWILWCVYIGGAIIMFLHIEFVSELVLRIPFAEGSRTNYLANHLENNVAYSSLFGNIERLITMFFVIIFYNRLANNKVGNFMFINMYVLLYASFMMLAESSVMVQRFQYMFIASFWILYPLLLRYANTFKNQLVYIIVVCLISMKLIIIASNPCLEYENILTGVSDFDQRMIFTLQQLGK